MVKMSGTMTAVCLLAGAAALAAPTRASAFPALAPSLVASAPLAVEKTAYFYDGREYCFYPDGWHGPGFYLCGFPYRRGFYFAPGFAGFRGGPGIHGRFGGGRGGPHPGHGPFAGHRGGHHQVGHGGDHNGRHGGGHKAAHGGHHR